ncbi:MAG TPA: ABC transporter permease [Vicinamibacterales bacterium]|jgi:putative ABC transport system permease protein
MMRLYSWLLHLYPASFRAEYGGEMRAIFGTRLRRTSGPLATLLLWAETFVEVASNAAAVHWDILLQDLRYTARTLARTPGFTLTAISVIALGVGANTAAFSVADFVIVRPLPYADADRLVKLWEAPPDYNQLEVAPPNYRDWKASATSFEAMGAYYGTAVNLVGEGDPQRLQASTVTADLLPILGVRPIIGRLFSAAEEREGATGTVVVSYGLWQTRFGGDAGLVGRRVLLDGTPRVVIGVMPQTFHFPNREVALWMPMGIERQNDDDRTNNYWNVLARLRPGVTLTQARSDMGVVARRLQQQHPKELEKVGASVVLLREEYSSRSRLLLLALGGAAACVLLIACANLANLLLARALNRRKELLVRSALGSGRERLVRQWITESLILAALGGTLGVGLASAAVPLLAQLVPTTLPIAQSPSVDLRVLLFAALVAALTGIGFGVLPAWRAAGMLDLGGLRDGARSGGGRRERARSVLVVTEVMASVVLLVSAGLLLRTLWNLQGTDAGFEPQGVLTLQTALPLPKYDSAARRAEFFRAVLTDVRAIPGVSGAAYITGLPMAMGGGVWPVTIPGESQGRVDAKSASSRYATPGYFASLGIPLRRGRDISDEDSAERPFVAVVSESFARRYWPGGDPLGKRFTFGPGGTRTIVGVVGDVRVRGPEQASEPQVYLPYRQVLDGQSPFYHPRDMVIRTSIPASALVPTIRRIVSRVDPQQPISNVRPMSDVVAEKTAARSVQVRVLGAFAAIAFLLAAVGIHGLLSFAVSNRRHEIGVRIALGARRSAIVRMVMGQGVALAAAGVIPGLAIAYAAGRAMGSLLAGVEPGDAPTFAAAAALCVVMTLAGSLLPTLRALRVDPVAAFRSEV